MINKFMFIPSLMWNILRKSETRRWADMIEPHLVLGALPLSHFLPSLFTNHGITRVLSIVEPHEYEYVPCDLEKYGINNKCWIRCQDFYGLPAKTDFQRALEFIKETKEQNECVYVHCKAGRNRSAMLVICHLIEVGDISLRNSVLISCFYFTKYAQ
ncbi:hypothetical protein HZS_7398 [Henneguya salminicola]|nr:hypothetical protein HZS_7398 [Henneguya salminicola]